MPNQTKSPSRRGRALRQVQRPQSLSTMMKCVLLALPFTVLLGALLLSATTALLLSLKNPIRFAGLLGALCLYATAALGGMLATRLYGRRSPVLCGFFSGLLLMLCLGIPALFLQQSIGNQAATLLMRLFIPLASLAGALPVARKRKMRYRRAQKR